MTYKYKSVCHNGHTHFIIILCTSIKLTNLKKSDIDESIGNERKVITDILIEGLCWGWQRGEVGIWDIEKVFSKRVMDGIHQYTVTSLK